MEGFLLQLYKREAARCKAPGSRLKEQWNRPGRLPRARGSDAKGDVTPSPRGGTEQDARSPRSRPRVHLRSPLARWGPKLWFTLGMAREGGNCLVLEASGD